MSSAGAFHRFEDAPRLSQRWILPPLIPGDCGREEIQSTPWRTPPYIRRQTFAPGNKPYSSSCPSEESCCCPLPQSTNQNLPAAIPPRSTRADHASRPCVSPGPGEPATSHIYFRRLQSSLASPVRRVAVWAEQQRDMKTLFPISNMKYNFDQRIHAVEFAHTEIGRGVETKTIKPGCQRFVLG